MYSWYGRSIYNAFSHGRSPCPSVASVPTVRRSGNFADSLVLISSHCASDWKERGKRGEGVRFSTLQDCLSGFHHVCQSREGVGGEERAEKERKRNKRKGRGREGVRQERERGGGGGSRQTDRQTEIRKTG